VREVRRDHRVDEGAAQMSAYETTACVVCEAALVVGQDSFCSMACAEARVAKLEAALRSAINWWSTNLPRASPRDTDVVEHEREKLAACRRALDGEVES
jgi:hypothetical protein